MPPRVCVPTKLSVAADSVSLEPPETVRPSLMVIVPFTVIGEASVTPSSVPLAADRVPAPVVASVVLAIVPPERLSVLDVVMPFVAWSEPPVMFTGSLLVRLLITTVPAAEENVIVGVPVSTGMTASSPEPGRMPPIQFDVLLHVVPSPPPDQVMVAAPTRDPVRAARAAARAHPIQDRPCPTLVCFLAFIGFIVCVTPD